MFDKLLNLFAPVSSGRSGGEAALRTAVAALLVDAARTDGVYDASERKAIAGLLATRFGLDAAGVERLLAEGEAAAADSVQLYGLTKTVRDGLDHDERVQFLEMLWEVVYADGVLHDFEANLMRKVAGLLYVSDVESGLARKKVRERLGSTE